jgi:hypothetical protein
MAANGVCEILIADDEKGKFGALKSGLERKGFIIDAILEKRN